jgi:hypothetical protein
VLAAGSLALRVHAAAPPLRYEVDTQKRIVTDTRTGLVWQLDVDAGSYSFSGAQTHCTGATTDGGGFHSPLIKELLTLVDPTETSPAIDPTAFPGTPATSFWSSSVVAGSSANAWQVNFTTGGTSPTGKSSTLRVRCVR